MVPAFARRESRLYSLAGTLLRRVSSDRSKVVWRLLQLPPKFEPFLVWRSSFRTLLEIYMSTRQIYPDLWFLKGSSIVKSCRFRLFDSCQFEQEWSLRI